MPTNRSNIKVLGTKTWIIILGILVALMISINTGILSLSDLQEQKNNVSDKINSLLATNVTAEDASDNLPTFLQLSQDLHKLYSKITK
ncbi:MAG: hypothetical protein NXI20_14220 [bacterium]|nr:hypothetical protein [bacterium]